MKAPPKKGAVVEDKNTPKTVVIDYVEPVNGTNYAIFEKNYN